MKQGIYFSLIAIFLLGFISVESKKSDQDLSRIPTAEQVGVGVLPDAIEPVKAPFQTIEFEKPQFPSDTIFLSLSKEGINTASIQQAINMLSEKGGGVVIVPKGRWLTGRIILKDRINLHFQDKAVLCFSGDLLDYQPAVFTRIEGIEVMSAGACIYANNAENIAITGKGRLIGPADGSLKEKAFPASVNIEEAINVQTPVQERIADGINTSSVFLPMFISPINCKKVYIEDVSLENTAFWNIVPVYCDNVIIRGITINSVGIPRGDGIDVESSKNVLIEYSSLSCGDDCFTIKSGRGLDGIRVNKPTENVIVRYCFAEKGLGGITCGSETAGVIKNIYVHDCVFMESGVGIRFKTRRPRGGGGENLFYERIRLNLSGDAIKWDMLGSRRWVGELANRLPAREVNELTPFYNNIHIKDLIVENSEHFIQAIGIPESPIKNFSVENAIVKCLNILDIRDMRNATFSNIKIFSNNGDMDILDSKNIKFNTMEFDGSNQPDLSIKGEFSDSIFVESSLNIRDTTYILSKK